MWGEVLAASCLGVCRRGGFEPTAGATLSQNRCLGDILLCVPLTHLGGHQILWGCDQPTYAPSHPLHFLTMLNFSPEMHRSPVAFRPASNGARARRDQCLAL